MTQSHTGHSSARIRVLIADDHAVVRRGLRALLGEHTEIEVVGEARDGREAMAQAEALQPDVILMDLVMPGTGGIEAIREITARRPGARILVLTSFSGDDHVFPAIKAGAMGYLLKDVSPQELFQAICSTHRGESSLHPTIAAKLIQELNRPAPLPPTPDPLTERELTVLKMVALGLSNQEIAARLVISERTVGSHVSNILGKLHLANRTQAALYALREGLTSLDTDST